MNFVTPSYLVVLHHVLGRAIDALCCDTLSGLLRSTLSASSVLLIDWMDKV